MNERERQACCQQRAKFLLLGLHDGRHTLHQALTKILRRWPKSTADSKVQHELVERWQKEDEFCEGRGTP